MASKVNSIFTPASMPTETYVDRDNGKLFGKLSNSLGSGKMVMVTGLTKSGKTVLVKKLFGDDNVLWLDGGSFSDEDSFWRTALDFLNGFVNFEFSEARSKDLSLGSSVGGGLIPANVNGKLSEESRDNWVMSRQVPSKSSVIRILKENKIPVVIDDFHYLEESIRKNVVRAFKPLVFDNIPIILIAIPHRNSEILKSEREMTGRVEWINIPLWSHIDLKKIPDLGFPLLNLNIDCKIIDKFVLQSRGSPSLMQEFCKALANNISSNEGENILISQIECDFFKNIAEFNGREIFERLKSGPSTHGKERIRYKLKNGETEETYGLILYALKNMRPGVETIKLEDLRKKIHDLTLLPPQKNQITFSLGHMSKISLNDSASSPVVDWEAEGEFLHITDPYFSFFLEWAII